MGGGEWTIVGMNLIDVCRFEEEKGEEEDAEEDEEEKNDKERERERERERTCF